MIKRIIYIINIAFVLLLLASYLGAYVPPHVFAKLSLLTYAYPFLLVINIAFCVLWLFWKWLFMIVPLAAILLQMNYIPRLVNISTAEEKADEKAITINFLTYNVCGFIYDNGREENRTDSLLAMLERFDIDVVAMQDFPRINTKNDFHNQLIKQGYKYFYSLYKDKKVIDKSVIYSRLPIVNAGGLLLDREEPDEFIFVDIKKADKEFRIYNLHLESYLLDKEEKSASKQIKGGKVLGGDKVISKTGESILKKLMSANIKRSYEVDDLSAIFVQTQKPYLIVGDFNDTPFSYTYHKLSKNMSDCFVKKGRGWGYTYHDIFPPYRIDYVLTSSHFKTLKYDSPHYDISDHYPVFVTLKLE